MPRASWKGFLRLSLVSCPIYLSPAATRTKSIRLYQVCSQRPRAMVRTRTMGRRRARSPIGPPRALSVKIVATIRRLKGWRRHVSAFCRTIRAPVQKSNAGRANMSAAGLSASPPRSSRRWMSPAAADRSCYSLRYSPTTSRRRKILPTGDFGISATNTYSRGRL